MVFCSASPHLAISFGTTPGKISTDPGNQRGNGTPLNMADVPLPCLILFDSLIGAFSPVQVFGLVLSTLSVALLLDKFFRSEALGRYCTALGEAPNSGLIMFLRLGAKSHR